MPGIRDRINQLPSFDYMLLKACQELGTVLTSYLPMEMFPEGKLNIFPGWFYIHILGISMKITYKSVTFRMGYKKWPNSHKKWPNSQKKKKKTLERYKSLTFLAISHMKNLQTSVSQSVTGTTVT